MHIDPPPSSYFHQQAVTAAKPVQESASGNTPQAVHRPDPPQPAAKQQPEKTARESRKSSDEPETSQRKPADGHTPYTNTPQTAEPEERALDVYA